MTRFTKKLLLTTATLALLVAGPHLHHKSLNLGGLATISFGVSAAYATGDGWGGDDPDYTEEDPGWGDDDDYSDDDDCDDCDYEEEYTPPETPHTTGGGGNTPVDTAVYCTSCGYNSVDLVRSYEGVDSFGNKCMWYIYVNNKGRTYTFPFLLQPDGHGHYRL